jgi:fructan beta-fructosidase
MNKMAIVVWGLVAATGVAAVQTQAAQSGRRPDIVLADFEGSDYGDWSVTGEAFGKGPKHEEEYFFPTHGHQFAYSMHGGDQTVGTLTSPEFRLQRRYITFLIGGGNHPGETCLDLIVDGKVVRTATGFNHEWLRRRLWNVSALEGRTARLRIVDKHRSNWGHVNVDHIVATNEERTSPWDVYEGKDTSISRLPRYSKDNANGWRLTGTLFGPEPGYAISPEFRVDHRYLHFYFPPIYEMTAACLFVDGQPVCASAYGLETSDNWRTWDAGRYLGRTACIKVVDRHMVNIPRVREIAVMLSDAKLPCSLLVEQYPDTSRIRPALPDCPRKYNPKSNAVFKEDMSSDYAEKYRPQFHYTCNHGGMNDPNGLLYYEGEYHMFMQHNGWGHAVSRDLIHWQQLEHAIPPDNLGGAWSGSAVVDWNNTSGFQTGREKPLVAVYASGNGWLFVNPKEYYCMQMQSLAYSNDRGRTWTKYAGNPVINQQDRDPKMFWHEPTKDWRLVLMQCPPGRAYFASSDLKHWRKVGEGGFGSECPDLFELPVTGEPGASRWVAVAGDGTYLVGKFDGSSFTPETDGLKSDYGPNYYATQVFNDIPKADGRTVQITWMKNWEGPEHVEYPGSLFNGQQMTIARELTLRRCPAGLRLFSYPVRELAKLHKKRHAWKDLSLAPGENPLAGLKGELFDVSVEFDPGDAVEVGLRARGGTVRYAVKDKKLICRVASAPVEPINNRLKLRVLVDRISLETFAQEGKVTFSAMFMPDGKAKSLELYAAGGTARIVSLEVYEVDSIWPRKR